MKLALFSVMLFMASFSSTALSASLQKRSFLDGTPYRRLLNQIESTNLDLDLGVSSRFVSLNSFKPKSTLSTLKKALPLSRYDNYFYGGNVVNENPFYEGRMKTFNSGPNQFDRFNSLHQQRNQFQGGYQGPSNREFAILNDPYLYNSYSGRPEPPQEQGPMRQRFRERSSLPRVRSPLPQPFQTKVNFQETMSSSVWGSDMTECGRVKPKLSNYVHSGKSTPHTSWPWHAQLILGGSEGSEIYCGGTLVTKDYIVTAAHCYDDLDLLDRSVKTLIVMKGIDLGTRLKNKKKQTGRGSWAGVTGNDAGAADSENSSVQKFRARSVLIHPDYSPAMTQKEARRRGVKAGPINDIAIIQLAHEDYDLRSRMMPVCMPDRDTELTPGTKCKIMGHGFMNADDEKDFYMPTALQAADVRIAKNEDCRGDIESRAIKSKISNLTYCVRGPTHPCVGDSGGPLICAGTTPLNINGELKQHDYDKYAYDDYPEHERAKWYLNGVTSFAVSTDNHDTCGRFKSAVFTKVREFIGWVRDTVTDARLLTLKSNKNELKAKNVTTEASKKPQK